MKNSLKLSPDLPHDEISERAVLGSLLLDPAKTVFAKVQEALRYGDFFVPRHQQIFQALIDLYESNTEIDPATLCAYLEDRKKLKSVGGRAYISELLDEVSDQSNIENYVNNVRQKAILRDIISLALSTVERGKATFAEPEKLLEEIEKEILQVRQVTDRGGFIELSAYITEALNYVNLIQKEGVTSGLKTGFAELDNMTAGFHKGELVIIAARPSMGKTAIGLNIAYHQAIKEGKRVAFFSIEMPRIQIVLRLLALAARIKMHSLRTGRPHLSSQEWAKLEQEASRLQKSFFYIDDSASLSILDIKTRARKLAYQNSIDIVFVDYLQLIKVGRERGRVIDSRSTEVGVISSGLKELAKELDIPVVALTQLNRGPEWRKGKKETKYMLSDLRESGSIEQDADVVIFLHREEQIDQDTDKKGIAELIIAKQRNGPTGKIHLAYQKETTKFANLEMRIGESDSGY